jgi:O-antigen/teichoic acid export membrane protein
MTILKSTLGLQWNKVRALITLKPFDVTTPEGRSKERYRRMLLTAGSGAMTRASGFLSFLITVPMTIGYLGKERYGAWMAISSLMAFLSFSDLGLSNGLISAISQAEGKGDTRFARSAISSVIIYISCISVLLIAGFWTSTLFIRWDDVLGLQTLRDHHESRVAIAIFVMLFAIGLPIKLGENTQSALQRGYMSNLWTTVGSLISFGLVFVAARHHAPIYILVLIVGGMPVVSSFCNATLLFTRQRPDLRPSLGAFDRTVANKLLHSGLLFFGLGIAGALAYDSQNIVIAHILGPGAVGTYAIVQRLYSTIPMIVAFVTQPLWPAFGEAIARKEWPWVYRALKRGIGLNALIAVAPAIVLSIFSGPIIARWTHGTIVAPKALVVGFSVWAVISAISSPICMLLNAAQVLLFQIVSAILFGLVTVFGMMIALHMFGLPGGVWTMLTAYLILQFGPYLVFLRRFFRTRLQVQDEQVA